VAYSTKADILKQLPEADLAQLTNDVDGSTVVDATVDAMIAKADNQINTYCRGKNDIPFNTTETPRVLDWSVSLAIYNLYKRRVDLSIPDGVETDHDDVIDELKAVRDGKIVVDDPDSVANTGGIYKGSGASQGKIFSSNAQGTGVLDQYYNGPC
jgi:phage gp36-like protein